MSVKAMEESNPEQEALYPFRSSETLESDKSQPPTPDGSGLPVNFHQIGPGLYRSSYPQVGHFHTLQSYGFKTVITFVKDKIPPANVQFMLQNGITHHQIHVIANKDPDTYASEETITGILRIMMDPENHPVLIHCNKGKHRTGCVSAIFRKSTGWPLDACLAEYEKFADTKARDLDKAFISRFDVTELKSLALEKGFVTGAFSPQYNLAESSNASAYTNNTAASYESSSTMNNGAPHSYYTVEERPLSIRAQDPI